MEKKEEKMIATRIVEIIQELDVDTHLSHSIANTCWSFYANNPGTHETIFSFNIYDWKEANRIIREMVSKL